MCGLGVNFTRESLVVGFRVYSANPLYIAYFTEYVLNYSYTFSLYIYLLHALYYI